MSTDIEPHQIHRESPPELPPSVLQTPINVRSTSLAVLALLAIIGFLYLARAFFIPIALAVVASYALTPVVNWLAGKAKLPKVVGAGLTLALLLTCVGVGLNSLQPEAIHILDIVPRATAKFRAAVQRTALEPAGAVEKMKKAATEIERAANAAATTASAPRVRAPEVGAPSFEVREYIVMGTTSAIAGIGQLVVVVALVYFLLIAGDSFRRTLIRISGDTLSK